MRTPIATAVVIVILLTPCLLFAQQSRLEALAETIKASRPVAPGSTETPASAADREFLRNMPAQRATLRDPLQQSNDVISRPPQRPDPNPATAISLPKVSKNISCGNPRDPLGTTQLFGVPTSLTAPSIEMIHDATLHDVAFLTPRIGFAVGDHGAIWHTSDGGDHWQLQVTPLDISLRSVQFTDQLCGTVTGYYTLPITGESRRVVLVTNDGGATWKQQTGNEIADIKNTTHVTLPGITVPLRRVVMTSDERGTAVGYFGTIVGTSDSGRSWVIQRQGARRLAVLVIVSAEDDLPLELMTKLAAEDGYLCGVVVLSQCNSQLALEDAITRTGAILIDANANNAAANNTAIATLIRTWQPEVVFTTSSLVKLVDETQVRKIVALLPTGIHGETMVSAIEVQPRLGRSLAEVAWESRSVLGLHSARLRTGSMIGLQTVPNSLIKTAHPTDPMAGVTLLPNSGARRSPIGAERPDLAAEQERHQIQGQLRDALEAYRRSVAEQTAPTSLQLVESTIDRFAPRLQPTTVATTLWQWGDSLHMRGDWDLAAMAFHTLAQRYAAHPLANAAAQRLSIYRNSEEAAMRLREKLPVNTTPAKPILQDDLPTITAKRTAQRPYLDGDFSAESDREAWSLAALYRFTETPTPGENDTHVMMTYDDEYLYIALRCGCTNSVPESLPNNTTRPRDADLTQHDRVTITLDVDRCGQLAYTFTVDERGFVHEACGDDISWNPDWYVANTRDGKAWFIEMALPLAALTRTPPTAGSVWGLGLRRTTPPGHNETWCSDAGLLLFE